MSTITDVFAREIIDSRGNPTVECDIVLDSGVVGRAAVPSGASTGKAEAVEIRDNDERFSGKGVLKAVEIIRNEIAECILGLDAERQAEIDRQLVLLDGTSDKSRFGANSILAVSLAIAKASALNMKMPLFRYVGGTVASYLPVPMMNVINGGAHANNNLDIQELMIVPYGFGSFRESLRCGCEIFQSLKILLEKKSLSSSVGDEGGFSPSLKSHEEALDLIINAIEVAGYQPKEDVGLALDCASSEFYRDGKYLLQGGKESLNADEFIDFLESLCNRYPIVSIEDGIAEDDWKGWKKLTQRLGSKIQLVGDDLFVTNTKLLQKGIDHNVANSILIKINQIGTLSETLAAIELAKKNSYSTVVSHRSGETEDVSIADIAVGTNAYQIKTGSLSRSERVCKYNQLLRIEEDLGQDAKFLGKKTFSGN